MKTFIGISSFQILAMFRRGLFYSYLAIYLRHFLGLSVTMTSLFATLPMLLNVLAQRYLWGTFSDKYQKRRSLIIWGEILGGIGTILLWYFHRIPDEKIHAGWIIIIGLTLIEVFWSMSNIGWSALISDVYAHEDRGRIMGKLEGVGGVGRIAGVLIGGLLYDGMGRTFPGWGFHGGSLFFISGIVMFLSVFPMLMVPEGGIKKGHKETENHGPVGPFHLRGFVLFIAAMCLINFGRNSVAVTMSQYLTLESGFNLSAITLSHLVNIRSVAIIITGFTTGRLLSRAGVGNLLVFGSCAAVASLFMLGAADSIPLVALANVAMGFSEVLVMASSYQLAAAYIPAE
ncbi:MAG: MFS transporter, partial [Verrucomicrobia bacterium]|nr:MFS transporter [Verrucomicrobiota bacterium]